MDSMPVVFDISSDEEGWGERRGGGEDGGGGDDADWISELLDKYDREVDNSDDVVLVREVVLNPKPRSKSSVKDLDDDCVVLDGNPDKPVVIENNADDDSDDLLIVGEKGQIACRDYPHPRHHCAKFPFTSTPHERQCHQCHCYVCDSLAPCIHWGNGTSSTDHCHATDKDEFWKLLRSNIKYGEKASLPVRRLTDTYLPTGLPQTTQVPPLTLMQPDSLAQNQVSRPTTIHACSTSANFGIPNIISQGRNQQSLDSRNKFRPRVVSQQSPSTRNNIIRRDRKHNHGNLRPQHAIFKRTGSGSAGNALTTNRSGYHLSYNNHVAQNSGNPSPMAASNDENPTRWQDFPGGMTSDSNVYQAPSLQNTGSSFGNSLPSHPHVSSQSNMSSVFVNSVLSQPQVSSQPSIGSSFVNSVPSPQASSQPNMGCNFENSVPSQLQVSSHPSIGSSFVNSVPSLHASSQPNMGSNFDNFENSLPSQLHVSSDPSIGSSFVNSVHSPQASSQPNMGSIFENSVPSLQAFSQPNMGSNFVNSVPSQLLVPSQPSMGCSFVDPVPSQSRVYSQVSFQEGNEAEIALDLSFSDVNTSWVAPTGQSNQQPLADNSQIQSAKPTYHPSLVREFDPQIPASTIPSSLDFQFGSWMLENHPVSGDLENSGLNVYSPEPAPLDAGFLFDF